MLQKLSILFQFNIFKIILLVAFNNFAENKIF